MELIDFFKQILPEDCVYYLVLFRDGRKPEHVPFRSFRGLTEAAYQYNHDNTTVYFACAGYNDLYVESSTKRQYRVVENQRAAQAFWLDLDCGEGKSYPNKVEAASAVAQFCMVAELPIPLLVSSGYGLHVYWPLSKPVSPEKWNHIAQALKAATTSLGLLADPTRTADFASILRPPGTHNKKGEWKEVKVLNAGKYEVTDAKTFWNAVKPYAELASPKALAP